MEILVGRGGNQSLLITDKTVSAIHCKIEVMDSGFIAVTNLSISGTFLNGDKLNKRTLVKREDILRLGTSFSVTVGELIKIDDFSIYTCHQIVRKKFQTKNDLQVFLNTSSQRFSERMSPYTIPVAKSALAIYLMEEEKYNDAQKLIYEAGDAIYSMQDGSNLLMGVYATLLTVCARLYYLAEQFDASFIAIKGACGIFDYISSIETGCSVEQRYETYSLAVDLFSIVEDKNEISFYNNKLQKLEQL